MKTIVEIRDDLTEEITKISDTEDFKIKIEKDHILAKIAVHVFLSTMSSSTTLDEKEKITKRLVQTIQHISNARILLSDMVDLCVNKMAAYEVELDDLKTKLKEVQNENNA